MKTENNMIDTHNELLADAEEIVNLQNFAFFKRKELLRKAGATIGNSERYLKAKELDGHSALIGAQYKSIRRACGISLETMAYKCDVSEEELKSLEACGFITVWKDRFWHIGVANSLVKTVYTGVLNIALSKSYAEPEEFCFNEMIELNTAYTSDIQESLWELELFAEPHLVRSFKNVLDFYEEIHEMLAPYLEL